MFKSIVLIALFLIAVASIGRADEAHLVKPDEIPQGFVGINPIIVEAKPNALDNSQVQGRANQNQDGFQPIAISDLIAKANAAKN